MSSEIIKKVGFSLTIGEKNATNDHSPRDFIADILNMSDLTCQRAGSKDSGKGWLSVKVTDGEVVSKIES